MKRALEADLAADLLELPGDPRDLAQAELVDLLGRHVGRGRRLDEVAVELVAALHVHEAGAVARVCQIVVLEEIAQPRQRGVQLLGDRGAIFPGQAGAVGVADRRREFLDRPVIRRVLGRRA